MVALLEPGRAIRVRFPRPARRTAPPGRQRARLEIHDTGGDVAGALSAYEQAQEADLIVGPSPRTRCARYWSATTPPATALMISRASRPGGFPVRPGPRG
ncbi:MAG: hypothetical protein U5L11_10075 [Arhodomonas sp.]|nr:hypothetical protein [Arhodomonas sp.]